MSEQILEERNLSIVRLTNAYFNQQIAKEQGLRIANIIVATLTAIVLIVSSVWITVINLKKTQLNVLPELVKEIENLRTNDFVRRSNTLHLKQSKINMVTLFVLLQDYSQEDLINLIPRIPAYIDRDFYTISYLKRLLKKAMKGDTI